MRWVTHLKQIDEFCLLALLSVCCLLLQVGQNLFNYMQSFCSVQGNTLIVPANILDQWYTKLKEKAKVDPEYLNRFDV